MLEQGLYEQVVNTEIKDELRQLPEGSKHVEKIDAAESSAVLTQYLSEVVHIWTSRFRRSIFARRTSWSSDKEGIL